MTANETWQWSLVAFIILLALIWISVKAVKFMKNPKKGDSCGCCSEVHNCKARDLKDASKKARSENCHDGQSATNL